MEDARRKHPSRTNRHGEEKISHAGKISVVLPVYFGLIYASGMLLFHRRPFSFASSVSSEGYRNVQMNLGPE